MSRKWGQWFLFHFILCQWGMMHNLHRSVTTSYRPTRYTPTVTHTCTPTHTHTKRTHTGSQTQWHTRTWTDTDTHAQSHLTSRTRPGQSLALARGSLTGAHRWSGQRSVLSRLWMTWPPGERGEETELSLLASLYIDTCTLTYRVAIGIFNNTGGCSIRRGRSSHAHRIVCVCYAKSSSSYRL